MRERVGEHIGGKACSKTRCAGCPFLLNEIEYFLPLSEAGRLASVGIVLTERSTLPNRYARLPLKIRPLLGLV